MAQTPEARAKKAVKKIIEAAGCYYITPATGGYGASGAPDFMGVHEGRMWACEVKADSDLTELQKDNLRRIEKSGGYGFVVRISKSTSRGLVRFSSFMGVSAHVAGQFQEAAGLDKDDFRAAERGGILGSTEDGPQVVGRARG